MVNGRWLRCRFTRTLLSKDSTSMSGKAESRFAIGRKVLINLLKRCSMRRASGTGMQNRKTALRSDPPNPRARRTNGVRKSTPLGHRNRRTTEAKDAAFAKVEKNQQISNAEVQMPIDGSWE